MEYYYAWREKHHFGKYSVLTEETGWFHQIRRYNRWYHINGDLFSDKIPIELESPVSGYMRDILV